MFISVSGNPNVIANIMITQENCNSFTEAIRVRNELLINSIVKPKEHLITPQSSIDTQEILDSISPILISSIISSTDDLVTDLPKLSDDLKVIHKEMYIQLKYMSPECKFIQPEA